MSYKKTLVIGDAHADPRFSNERFNALGNFILEHQPDNIVQIGDWGNVDSVSFHYRNKPLIKEGMRLSDDLRSMQSAFDMTFGPMMRFNATQRAFKQKQYRPNIYWIIGNHEERTNRYIVENPELAGFVPTGSLISYRDVPNIVQVPYTEGVNIEGCRFTHAPINPSTGQAFGGKFVTKRALEFTSNTIVFGHLHVLQFDSIRRTDVENPNGRRVDSLCVGCYIDYTPDYVRGVRESLNWWSGLVELTHLAPGEIDITTYGIERIKREYL